MTDIVQVAMISSGTALLGLFLNRLWSRHDILESRRISKEEHASTAKKVEAAEKKVDGVHDLVNHEMQELKAAVRQQGHAEGLAEGRQAAIDERRDRVIESERVEDRGRKKKPGMRA